MFALTPPEVARLVATRRDLHRHPELGFEEHRTAAHVRERLAAIGLVTETLATTGVVAVVDTGRPGRTVLLRADMDALPIQEANTHEYRSVHDGRMHACGHDGHTAVLLSVAEQLVAARDVLPGGRVVLAFQPAEEGRGGALRMLGDGLLERFRPDECAALHLWLEAPSGEVLVTEGPLMAGGDLFEVSVRGLGGHGAMPHRSRDPIVAAAQMILALQTVVARLVDPSTAAVLTVGRIAGGSAPNVIPERVTFGGTVRAFSRDVQDEMASAFRRIVEGIAHAADVEVDILWEQIAIPLVNSSGACRAAREAVHATPGLRLGPSDSRTMASEDMAYLLDRCPGVFVPIGARNPAVGAGFPHHHPNFEIDEGVLPAAVTFLCHLAMGLLRKP